MDEAAFSNGVFQKPCVCRKHWDHRAHNVQMSRWQEQTVENNTKKGSGVAFYYLSKDICLSLAFAAPLSSHMVMMWLVSPHVWSKPPSVPGATWSAAAGPRKEETQGLETQIFKKTEKEFGKETQTEDALLNLWKHWVLWRFVMAEEIRLAYPQANIRQLPMR